MGILPSPGKELLQQFHAFHRQHALHDLHAVIQQVGIGNPEFAAHTAEAQVARAKHQPPHPRRHQSARAHKTRFERRVKRGIFQAIVSGMPAGFPQRQHLGMRGRIGGGYRRISAAPDHLARHHHYRAHGHFARPFGFARQFQGFAHMGFMHGL